MNWTFRKVYIVGLLQTLRKLPFLLVFALAALWTVAAGPADSTTLALDIAAGVLAAVTPFIGLAQLHLKDEQIVLASMVLALVIGVVAQIATHQLSASNLQGGIGPLFEEVVKLWAIQQAVFQLFKDNGRLGPLLTHKPLLVAQPTA